MKHPHPSAPAARAAKTLEDSTPSAEMAAEILQLRGKQVVAEHVFWASLAVFPIPVLNIPVTAAVQLRMLRNLCALYGVRFSERASESVIASLLGGGVSGVAAHGAMAMFGMAPVLWFGSLLASPFTGILAGAAIASGCSAAATYALGEVMLLHMHKGGTLLDFKASDYTETFLQLFREKRQAGSATPGSGNAQPPLSPEGQPPVHPE